MPDIFANTVACNTNDLTDLPNADRIGIVMHASQSDKIADAGKRIHCRASVVVVNESEDPSEEAFLHRLHRGAGDQMLFNQGVVVLVAAAN